MAFTSGNDINILQGTDALSVGAGAGNDRYVLDASTLNADQQITITDAQGSNTLQLVGGLEIVSSLVTGTAVQLVLNNGAKITVLGANTFNFQTGGNPLNGTGGLVQNFADFVTLSLGLAEVPTGNTPVEGGTVTVQETGGTDPVDPTEPTEPTEPVEPVVDHYELRAAKAEANEGEANTFTVVAVDVDGNEVAVKEAVSVDFELKIAAGDTASLADFNAGAFNPVRLTIAAGQSVSAPFSVEPISNDGTETTETYTVTATVAGETLTVNAKILDGSAGSGQTFVLTKGLDVIPGLNGSNGNASNSGNDTILGSVAGTGSELLTASAIDVINGGAGTDTFKLSSEIALTNANLPSISNVEIIEASGALGVTLDTSAIAGVTNLNVIKAGGAVLATAAATTDISVALKDAAAIATVAAAGGKDVTVTLTDAQSVVNVGVGAAADAAGTVTVKATGAAVTNAAATALGAINVTGGKSISVTQATGDTSGLVAGGGAQTQAQGAVTVIGNATTTDVTVKQTAEIGAVNGAATVAAVTETASVKFAAMTAGQTLTTNGLTFTAAKNLTKEEVATAFSNLINGTVPVAGDTQGSGIVANGVYTGAITGWTSGAASGDTVVFTATTAGNIATDLAFTGTGSATVTTTQGVAAAGTAARLGVTAGAVSVTDASGTIKTITIDGVGAANASTTTTTVLETLNLSNVAAGATVTVADSAATLALNLDKVGTTATAAAVTVTTAPTTLNIKSTGANNVNLTSALTETLNVSGTGVLNAGTAALGALKSVKVTETAGLTLAAGTAASVTSIDTTGTTGTVTASINGQTATYTGGAGVDNVTLTTTAPTKAIDTGAGNDRVTLASGTTAMGANGSINAGDGTADTLVMVAADAVTASGGTTFATKVTGFERLEVTGATGAQAIDTAALGNYNDVTIASAAGGSATTLNNLTSGATIRLNDGSNVSTTAAIKDADKSTTDVLNIIVTDGARGGVANNNGTIVAAEVETINITTVDGVTETPTNLVADQQNLTLQATKATKIVVTGDAALNLTNTGNVKLAEIDGSALTATAALTVQAAGNTATTIKGGSGNDVLTASATGTGNVAQVSTLTFTEGGGTGAMAAGDTITMTVGGFTTAPVPFTTNFLTTLTNVATAIQNLNAGNSFTAVHDGAGKITVTALAAGTPFTANTVFTPAAASSVTGVYADGAVNQVLDEDTVQFTDGSTALTTGDALTITLIPAVGAPVTYTQNYVTSFAATVAALAGQLTTAGYTVTDNGTGLLTITAKAGQGALGTGAGVTGATTNATATPSEGTVNFVADADTMTFTEVTAMGPDDTITISVTNGVNTYTTAPVAFITDYATTQAAVATAVAGLNGGLSFNAAYVGGVLTVTDKVAGGSPITNIGLTFTNGAANTVSSAFTTTTENVTVTAVADKLFGGAGNDTLVNNAGLSELTGGEGNDLFVISTAGINVNSYNTIMDFQAGDLLQMSGAVAFKSAKVDLGGTAVFQDLANAAINALGANEAGWFQFGTDTYVVMDVATGGSSVNGTTFQNGDDFIVKITGLVDLSNASFNATQGTIGLV